MPSGPTMAPASAHSASPFQSPAQARQALLKEIGAKRGKFSEAELSGLRNNQDLIETIVAKYSHDLTKVQGDVATLMHGRQI